MVAQKRIEMINKPIRFLACSWCMDWEFDRPCLVLEPFIRYGFRSPQSLIEDLVVDICTSLEKNIQLADEDISLEFQWRGWNLEELKEKVEAVLKRDCVNLKKYKTMMVYEEYYQFTQKDKNIIIEETCPTKRCVF